MPAVLVVEHLSELLNRLALPPCDLGWVKPVPGRPPIGFEAAQPLCRCDLPGPPELGAVNPDAVHDQRHHRADTGHRHQAPAHVIVPDHGQQATVQNADLFAKRPPDNEQRFSF